MKQQFDDKARATNQFPAVHFALSAADCQYSLGHKTGRDWSKRVRNGRVQVQLATSNSAVSDFQQPRVPGTPSFYRCFLGSKKNECLYGSFLNRVVTNQQRHSPRLEQPSSDLGIFSKELDEPSREERPQSIIDILIDKEAIRKQEELLAKSVA